MFLNLHLALQPLIGLLLGKTNLFVTRDSEKDAFETTFCGFFETNGQNSVVNCVESFCHFSIFSETTPAPAPTPAPVAAPAPAPEPVAAPANTGKCNPKANVEHNGKWYWVQWKDRFATKYSWSGAKSSCSREGMKMISMDSPSTRDFFLNMLERDRYDYFWAGATIRGYVLNSVEGQLRYTISDLTVDDFL